MQLFGIRITVIGKPITDRGVLMVANHSSYLDILIMSAIARVSFVAKAKLRRWPFFGRWPGCRKRVFVERDGRSATGEVARRHSRRLRDGDALVLFPEGTSTDGNRVMPSRARLMGAARRSGIDGMAASMCRCSRFRSPMSALHGMPMGRENRPLFAWYGDMELVPHLWEALKAGPLDVVVRVPPAVDVDSAAAARIAALAEAIAAGRRALAATVRARPTGSAGSWPAIAAGCLSSLPIADNRGHEEALRQDLWLPDERLRFRPHGGSAGAARLCPAPKRPEDADMVILNTCHIREKAAEKIYSELGRLKKLKEDKARTAAR